MNNFKLLNSRLRKWQRWIKLQKSVYYGSRGLVLGILISAVTAIFLIPSSTLLLSEYFVFLSASGTLGLVIAVGIAWLWPQSPLKVARKYEQVFNLKERVGTAIELSQADHVDQTWQQLQLNDALEATEHIIPKDGLSWHVPKVEIIVLILGSCVVFGTWFYGQRFFQRAEIIVQNQHLIEAEIDNLEELISDIDGSEQLTVELKQEVSSTLQESIEDMKLADSLTEAVSALSEAQQKLEDFSAPGITEFEGLQSAGEELSKNHNSPLTTVGEALAQGDLQAAAKNLTALDLNQLNAQELTDLTEQLTKTSELLENSSPELAKKFQDAAEALQNDDLPSAQEALAEAIETISESIQRIAASEAAQRSVEELTASQERLTSAAMFGSSAQNSRTQSNSNEEPEGEHKGSFGSQAGSGEFEESKTPGKEAGLTPLTQGNTPGDNSEKQYDSVYAPQRLGGKSDEELSLGTGENSTSDAVGSINSPFAQNPQSSVPYSDVYSSYKENTQQALESGSIPLSLQPIVRDYFSSLDPR